jgi:monoamine oxidase
MNFRVDLILADEQRSASILNPKSITRIVCIVVPLSILLVIAKFAFGVYMLGNQAADAEKKWAQTEPKAKKAEAVRAALNENLDIVNEMAGWRETHIKWHEHLAAIQAAVPTNIQLTALSVQQSLLSDPAPSRSFQMVLSGRSVGDPNGIRVVHLESAFGEAPPLKGAVKSAKVAAGSFVQDPSAQAKKDDRLFRIECAYSERVFK